MKRLPVEDLEHIFQNTQDIWESFRGKSIFLTGGTGFFGKWLLESFIYANEKLSLNIKIYVLSRDPGKFLEKFPFYRFENCIEFIQGDIVEFKSSINNVDYIIHGATEASAKLLNSNPAEMLNTLVSGTKHVLDFAKSQINLKGILLTSSGAVYGQNTNELIGSFREGEIFPIDFTNANSTYSEGKRVSELYFASYGKEYNIPVKTARCFAFVGPYLPLQSHFAIGNFINNVLNNDDIIVKGDGTAIRSYMYAADLIVWLLIILIKGINGCCYNVGSNSPYSISEIANKISMFGSSSHVVISQPNKSNFKDVYFPNTDKFLLDFPNLTNIDLLDAIDRTIKFSTTNERN